jgi:hypothetical protein
MLTFSNRHYELYPCTYDFDKTESCLLGLGVGVLVAATVSLSPSILDLAEIGADVVPLVFRCAYRVDRVASAPDVVDPESPWKNWIYVILNESEQEVRHQLETANLGNVSLLVLMISELKCLPYHLGRTRNRQDLRLQC